MISVKDLIFNQEPKALYEQKEQIKRKLPIEFYELFNKFDEKFASLSYNEESLKLKVSFITDEDGEFSVFIKALNILSKKLNVKTKILKYNKVSHELEMKFVEQ